MNKTKQIYAMTETNYAPAHYPAFVNLTEHKYDDRTEYSLAVRTRGALIPSEIILTPHELDALAIDIQMALGPDH